MPGLSEIRVLPPDEAPEPWGAWDPAPAYPSPDGTWVLRFSEGSEVRMGLPIWDRTQILHEGRDVSAEQHLADSLGIGAHPISTYLPWNVRGDKVVISTLHSTGSQLTSGFTIHDVATRRSILAEEDFWLRGGIWSPRDDLVLLITENLCRIVSGEGATLCSVGNQLGWSRAVAAGWTPNGESFFCAGPDAEAQTILSFFDPRDGRPVERLPLDPTVLVPYDSAAYAGLDRDTYCLVIRRGTRGVARLMDDWSAAEVNPTGTMRLAVFRPTSPVQAFASPGDGQEFQGCTVEQRWITVRITD